MAWRLRLRCGVCTAVLGLPNFYAPRVSLALQRTISTPALA